MKSINGRSIPEVIECNFATCLLKLSSFNDSFSSSSSTRQSSAILLVDINPYVNNIYRLRIISVYHTHSTSLFAIGVPSFVITECGCKFVCSFVCFFVYSFSHLPHTRRPLLRTVNSTDHQFYQSTKQIKPTSTRIVQFEQHRPSSVRYTINLPIKCVQSAAKSPISISLINRQTSGIHLNRQMV